MDDINRKSGVAIAQAVKDFTTQLNGIIAEKVVGMAQNQARLVDDAIEEATQMLTHLDGRIHYLETTLRDAETRATTAEASLTQAMEMVARLQGELDATRQTSQRKFRVFAQRRNVGGNRDKSLPINIP